MSKIGDWLKRLFSAPQQQPPQPRAIGYSDYDEEPKKLLRHFMLQLKDEFLYAKHPTNEVVVPNAPMVAKIEELIAVDTPLTWDSAYQIERLLVYIRPRSRLENETDRRVAETERQKLAGAGKYRAQLDKVNVGVAVATEFAEKAVAAKAALPPESSPETIAKLTTEASAATARVDAIQEAADKSRRAILAAVLDDLQWFYQQRILKRQALEGSARRLLAFGFFSMTFVAVPFIAFIIVKLTGWELIPRLIHNFPNYGLFTAASFGLLGAFFSRLISFQFTNDMTVEEAKNRYGLLSLAIRAGVGMCGAVIIYYMLGTELLGSTVKPNFEELAYKVRPVTTMLSADSFEVLLPSSSWCLLVIWSFLAGFSERLVPDTLSRGEGQLTGQQK
jgi:hypothetical protein